MRPSDGRKLYRPVLSKPFRPKPEEGEPSEADSSPKRIKLEATDCDDVKPAMKTETD